MARTKVRLDRAGMAAVAKSSEVRDEINERAEQVADYVHAAKIWVEGVPGDVALPVEVEHQTTDRARASVQLAHPSGMAVQAKHGVLTKGAMQAGLELGGGRELVEYTTRSGTTRMATRAQVDNWTRGSR